jgi:hypothetical protein
LGTPLSETEVSAAREPAQHLFAELAQVEDADSVSKGLEAVESYHGVVEAVVAGMGANQGG